MKIFVINPGSTSTKIALFIDEKPVWVAGAHHTADDLSEFHHVNEQYAYRKDFVLRLLAEADIPLDFDAVIASDDAMAVGALKYVHQINKSIPEDVNVVGFNNSELCVCCNPEMSSIDSQEEELSEIAVDSLIKVLAGKSVRQKMEIPCKFIKRNTTQF